MALGVDLFNGNSDAYNMGVTYNELLAAGGREPFLIHKGGQGWAGGPGGWIDWRMADAINRARFAGFKRIGIYWWLLRGNGAAQADLMGRALDMVGGRGKVGSFIDYEATPWDPSLNADAATMWEFLQRCVQIGIPRPVIYTAPWYSDGYPGARLSVPNVPLWWPGYVQRGYSVPISVAIADVSPNWMIPFDGWNGYAIRQWSSNVLVAGNPSDVDVSYLPDAMLDAIFGIESAPPPTPVPVVDKNSASRYDSISVVIHPGDTDASTGGKVHVWQKSLLALDPATGIKVDGIDGPVTTQKTKDFQAWFKVPGGADGVVGRNSWHAMGQQLTNRHITDAQVMAIGQPARAMGLSRLDHPDHYTNQGEHWRSPGRFAVSTADGSGERH